MAATTLGVVAATHGSSVAPVAVQHMALTHEVVAAHEPSACTDSCNVVVIKSCKGVALVHSTGNESHGLVRVALR